MIRGDIFIKTTEEFIKQSRLKHGDRYDYSDVKYEKSNKNVCIICKEEGHGCFYQMPKNHLYGQGCPKCASIKRGKAKSFANKYNSIRAKNPELLEYLVNLEDADNIKYGSVKKILMRCPYCGTEKMTAPNNIREHGFRCKICSNRRSLPEKFIFEILSQSNIDFKCEHRVNKNNPFKIRRYYDFYIPSLNTIIETHGMQHYNNPNVDKLKGQIDNDCLKYQMAIEMGVKPENYIVIDCRYSPLDWLKENAILQLGHIINISEVDFKLAYTNAQTTTIASVWECWNYCNKNYDSILNISKKFKITDGTVIKWIKLGFDLNKCEQFFKKQIPDKIIQYSLNGDIISTFTSVSSASETLNIDNGNIYRCLNNKRKSAGGFKWGWI